MPDGGLLEDLARTDDVSRTVRDAPLDDLEAVVLPVDGLVVIHDEGRAPVDAPDASDGLVVGCLHGFRRDRRRRPALVGRSPSAAPMAAAATRLGAERGPRSVRSALDAVRLDE